jgi:hypothetical protein
MEPDSLIISEGVYYPAVLKDVKKHKDQFRPVYEAFTNSLESIKLKRLKAMNQGNESITIDLYLRTSTAPPELFFDQLIISDTGIGFDEDNFRRLITFKDDRKGYHNRGSGRIQFLHFFDTAEYVSIFKDVSTCRKRSFTLSKHYLKKNAIVSNHKIEDCQADSLTVITLRKLIDEKDFKAYDELSATELKHLLITKYIMEFCTHGDSLPSIKIAQYIDGVLDGEPLTITEGDIPKFDNEKELVLNYFRLSPGSKDFEKCLKQEEFKLSAFKIDGNDLKKNELKFTSKGEVLPEKLIELRCLAPTDMLDGNRFLFLISGKYIDDRDGDTRGAINIQTREDFKKANSSHPSLYGTDEIFLDDIEDEANCTISAMYSEIRKKKEEKLQDIEKLKNMFLLDGSILKAMKISLEDTEEKILERVYVADSKTIAKKDAKIKKYMDRLDNLDPTDDHYQNKLNSITSNLVKTIPLQNRASLTHYVARRKLVLELFGKTLDRELEAQRTGARNIDEKLLHNLIFQQSSREPDESDLWLINEDFIYFKGTSETPLCDVMIDGNKIFKKECTDEEERYLLSLGENRKRKKPDVLLFPEEGKCIIIEFKNTNVNVAEHLNQINFYASLIRNFTEDHFQLDTFYGYLIGESIESRDVRGYDGDFIESYQFRYWFRPKKNIVGENDRRDGTLYTEVIKYSTLLDRARRRNDIFINKLIERTHSGRTRNNQEQPKSETT